MAGTVIVTGIPGVGKTTVLKELKSQADARGLELKVVTFGTVLNEIMAREGRSIDRDKMRSQQIGYQKKTQAEAASEIANKRDKGVQVVDTHMFVRTTAGCWAGLPQSVLEKLKPDLLVLIEASPEEIEKRRAGDETRTRDTGTREDVMFDINWSRSVAAACSVLSGAPVRVLVNSTGGAPQVAKELLDIIEEQVV